MTETLTQPIQQEQAQTHKLVEFMDKTHAQDIFASPETTEMFIKDLDYKQFEGFLNRVNGICREQPTSTRQMDGRGHIEETNAFLGWSIPEYEPPAVDDRQPLMYEVFQALQASHDLKQSGTMLGLVINAIHPYNDGNGRTSRFVYSLLTHGYNGSPDDKQYFNGLLTNTEGRKVVDLNPEKSHLAWQFTMTKRKEIANKFGYEGYIPSYGYGGYSAEFAEDMNETNILTNESIPLEARRALHSIVADKKFEATLFMEFMLESGRDITEYIKAFDEGKRNIIKLDKLLPELTSDDISKLSTKQSSLKKEYVETLINIFTNPDQQISAGELTEFYSPEHQN